MKTLLTLVGGFCVMLVMLCISAWLFFGGGFIHIAMWLENAPAVISAFMILAAVFGTIVYITKKYL